MEIVPDEAQLVRRVFDLAGEYPNISLREMASQLKAWASMIRYFNIDLLVYIGNTFRGTGLKNSYTVRRDSAVKKFIKGNE